MENRECLGLATSAPLARLKRDAAGTVPPVADRGVGIFAQICIRVDYKRFRNG